MIRSTIKSGLKKLLGKEAPAPQATPYRYTPPETPAAPTATQTAAAAQAAAPPAPVATPAPAPAPVAAAPEPAPAADPAPAPVAAAPLDDTVAGPALDPQAVQELLDEMVRPALQADGGDISLVKVEGNDVYVKLVGSCSSCPSSIMTMKMGVEALFREEFPSMGQLIQMD